MRQIFEQADNEMPFVHIYENDNNNVFIGNMSDVNEIESICISFTPDEAILFAKYVLKIAKEIKKNDRI